MSDLNRPRENRLKGKFKGLLNRLMGADRPRDERSLGSRLEFMTSVPTNSILTRYIQGRLKLWEREHLWCVQCENKLIG